MSNQWQEVKEYCKKNNIPTSEFQEKVDWYYISRYQHLSEDFIREFQKKVNWYYISRYQHLSDYIKKELRNRNILIPYRFDLLPAKKRYSLIKKYCKENGLEYRDNFLYAYKSVRGNMYSLFNCQVRYTIGKETRVTHCDCSNNEDSFGLSAWTKEEALAYDDSGRLLKVRVAFSDVGYLRSNGKIRCFGLTPVEEVSK